MALPSAPPVDPNRVRPVGRPASSAPRRRAPRWQNAVMPLVVVVTVALVSLLGLPPRVPSVAAQVSTSSAPLGLSAPSWVAPDLPAELRIASLGVLPGPDGSPSAVDVRFAGAFTPPAGRWRVSVGVGDPSGSWQRLSMVWDGAAATGVAEQLEGLSVADLGPVSASVDPAGSVVVGVPAGVLNASGGGVVWAEAILGEDTEPTLLVRTPWFPRAVLVGEGAPGLLQGSTLGVVVPAAPGSASSTAAPAVVDTGVPSVLELADGVLSVDRGAGPATDVGDVSSVVDLVTLVGTPGTVDGPASGPQVRVDLSTGSVELGSGSVLGPLGPAVGDGTVVGPSAGWLRDTGQDGSSTGPLEIDVAGAFAEVGQPDPGEALAVSVTRVLTLTDGSLVAAPGVVGDRSWLQAGGDTGATPSTPAITAGESEEGAAPIVPIVIGVVLGVVLVGGAMVFAGSLHRRRHPGPDDDWFPSAPGPPAGTGQSTGAVAGGAGAPPPAASPAPDPVPAPAAPDPAPAPAAADPVPVPDPVVDPVAGVAASPPEPEAVRPEPAATRPVGERSPGGVEGLDDDLDALTERLRRLRNEG